MNKKNIMGLILLAILVILGLFYFNDKKSPVSSTLPPVNSSHTPAIPEEQKVQKYLEENIRTLSPVPPSLGGNWYVVESTVDVETKSGTVTYEDGHNQEKKTFSYMIGADGEVSSLTINP